MKKNLRQLFHLKYGSHPGSAVLQGSAMPSYADYDPSKINLVHSRRRERTVKEREIMSAEERSFFSNHFKMDSPETVIFRASNSIAVEALNEDVNAIINLKKINELKSINHFIKEVNHKLPVYGL